MRALAVALVMVIALGIGGGHGAKPCPYRSHCPGPVPVLT